MPPRGDTLSLDNTAKTMRKRRPGRAIPLGVDRHGPTVDGATVIQEKRRCIAEEGIGRCWLGASPPGLVGGARPTQGSFAGWVLGGGLVAVLGEDDEVLFF